MSFGFSPSDILTLIALTQKAYDGWRSAGKRFEDITHTLDSFEIILKHVEHRFNELDALMDQRDRRQELERILRGCKRAVTELNKIQQRYQKLGNWDKFRLGLRDISSPKERLVRHMGLLTPFLLMTELDSIGKDLRSLPSTFDRIPSVIQGAVTVAFGAMLDSRANDTGSARSLALTTYGDDDKEAYKELRRHLRSLGIKDSDVREYRHEFVEMMKSILSSEKLPALVEAPTPGGVPTNAQPKHMGNSLSQASSSSVPVASFIARHTDATTAVAGPGSSYHTKQAYVESDDELDCTDQGIGNGPVDGPLLEEVESLDEPVSALPSCLSSDWSTFSPTSSPKKGSSDMGRGTQSESEELQGSRWSREEPLQFPTGAAMTAENPRQEASFPQPKPIDAMQRELRKDNSRTSSLQASVSRQKDEVLKQEQELRQEIDLNTGSEDGSKYEFDGENWEAELETPVPYASTAGTQSNMQTNSVVADAVGSDSRWSTAAVIGSRSRSHHGLKHGNGYGLDHRPITQETRTSKLNSGASEIMLPLDDSEAHLEQDATSTASALEQQEDATSTASELEQQQARPKREFDVHFNIFEPIPSSPLTNDDSADALGNGSRMKEPGPNRKEYPLLTYEPLDPNIEHRLTVQLPFAGELPAYFEGVIRVFDLDKTAYNTKTYITDVEEGFEKAHGFPSAFEVERRYEWKHPSEAGCSCRVLEWNEELDKVHGGFLDGLRLLIRDGDASSSAAYCRVLGRK